MGEIINFQEEVRKRLSNKIISTLGSMCKDVQYVADSYYQLMLEDPLLAIDQLQTFIDETRKINHDRAFVESVTGGPNHSWTGPMLDILGIVYPKLEKNVRKRSLQKCLNFLDKLNYFNAQNNVEKINEPWLVSDIIINQWLYWPDYKKYRNLLKEYPKWDDFSQHIKFANDFFLSFAITIPKYSSLEIRLNFYRQFPDLLDRTKDGIAALTFNGSREMSKENGNSIEENIKETLQDYDSLLHEDIRRKINEKKWIKIER